MKTLVAVPARSACLFLPVLLLSCGGSSECVSGPLCTGVEEGPTDACLAPPPGLLSWWPGDGNANDIVDGNNGTLGGGASFATGLVDQAFSLDGVDGLVSLGNAANLHVSAGDFTVDAWVKFDALRHPPGANLDGPAGDMAIVDKMSGLPNLDGWRLLKQDSNEFYFCLGAADNGCGSDHPNSVFSTTLAVVGTWFHVAAVKSSSSISIYVNGVMEATKPLPPFTDTDAATLLIGAHPPQANHLNGLVDEVELFDRALTASQIAAIFDAGRAGKCKS